MTSTEEPGLFWRVVVYASSRLLRLLAARARGGENLRVAKLATLKKKSISSSPGQLGGLVSYLTCPREMSNHTS